MSRLTSTHILATDQIINPTKEQQDNYCIKYLGSVPDDYEYIPYGIISNFRNTKLDECWVHTCYNKPYKTKIGSSYYKSYKKEVV